MNLLQNAVHAAQGSGEIVITAHRAEDWDILTLQDSGPGIQEGARPRLFEPLFTTKAKGTGLGLTISRQIIERHGGSIELAEPPARGAAFRIRLPRRRPEATASTRPDGEVATMPRPLDNS